MELDWNEPLQIHMRHTNLIEKVICRNKMNDAKPISSPLNPDIDLTGKTERLSETEWHQYRSNLGSLL